MKKQNQSSSKLFVILLITAVSALGGCGRESEDSNGVSSQGLRKVNLSSPDSTLNAAISKVQSMDLAGLQKILSKDALANYGNSAGLTALNGFMGSQNVLAGTPELQSRTVSGRRTDSVYSVGGIATTLTSQPISTKILDAQVECQSTTMGQPERERTTTKCKVSTISLTP